MKQKQIKVGSRVRIIKCHIRSEEHENKIGEVTIDYGNGTYDIAIGEHDACGPSTVELIKPKVKKVQKIDCNPECPYVGSHHQHKNTKGGSVIEFELPTDFKEIAKMGKTKVKTPIEDIPTEEEYAKALCKGEQPIGQPCIQIHDWKWETTHINGDCEDRTYLCKRCLKVKIVTV